MTQGSKNKQGFYLGFNLTFNSQVFFFKNNLKVKYLYGSRSRKQFFFLIGKVTRFKSFILEQSLGQVNVEASTDKFQ